MGMFGNSGIRRLMSTAYDRVSGLIVTLPGEHSRIHDGYAFKVNFEIGSLAQGASVSYSFKTPVGVEIHLQNIVLAASNADVAVELYRGTTANPLTIDSPGTDDATILGPHNLNDVLNTASGTVIKRTPTYTAAADGELWDRLVLPGAGSNQYQSTGVKSDSPNEEYLMKQDTYYVIKVVNTDSSNAASGVNVRLFWYGRLPV